MILIQLFKRKVPFACPSEENSYPSVIEKGLPSCTLFRRSMPHLVIQNDPSSLPSFRTSETREESSNLYKGDSLAYLDSYGWLCHPLEDRKVYRSRTTLLLPPKKSIANRP